MKCAIKWRGRWIKGIERIEMSAEMRQVPDGKWAVQMEKTGIIHITVTAPLLSLKQVFSLRCGLTGTLFIKARHKNKRIQRTHKNMMLDWTKDQTISWRTYRP